MESCPPYRELVTRSFAKEEADRHKDAAETC